MRILVISDTHGDISGFEFALSQQKKADLVIHLGDCERDVDDVKDLFPDKQFINVSGNCDFGSVTPPEGETVICSKRIFYTHGHTYHVKFGNDLVINEAKRRGARLVRQ